MNNSSRRWYKEPYVWLLIGIPMLAVIMGITFWILASRSFDGMVVDDYYRKGKQINRVLLRDQRGFQLGLSGQLIVDHDRTLATVKLNRKINFPWPKQLKLAFYHATSDKYDQDILLSHQARGTYTGKFPGIRAGIWNVQILTKDWRLIGRWNTNLAGNKIRLQPAYQP